MLTGELAAQAAQGEETEGQAADPLKDLRAEVTSSCSEFRSGFW